MVYFGVAGVAGRMAAIRAVETKLKAAHAVSADSAVQPEDAGLTSKRELGWVNYLTKQGKIGKTEDGKIWWKG